MDGLQSAYPAPLNFPESEFEMVDSQNETTASEHQIETNEVEPPDGGEEEVCETLSEKIARFLRTCWMRRRMMLCILFTGIIVSVPYALVQPNIYTSSTSLMPAGNSTPYPSITSLLSPGGGTPAELGGEALGLYDPDALFIDILESRNVQDGLINRLDLSRRYKTQSIDDTRKSLASATKIEGDRRSGVITIDVTDRNPVLASKMAQGYVEEVNRVLADNTTSAARRERIFLEGRVASTKDQLDETAKELSQFSSKSGAIDMPSQTKSMVDERVRLQAELIDGRSQLAALRQTYSEDNSRVRALEAHNAELQRELDKMGGLSRETDAKVDANKSPYPTAEELPALGLTYYDLQRKLTVEEALWEALTREYEAVKVEEAGEIPTVQVLDAANIPNRKSGPIRRLIVEIGIALSFIVACIVVLAGMIWEGMDAQREPKRLITEAVRGALDSRRWYWRLPGTKWVRRRLKGTEQDGSFVGSVNKS